MQDTQYPARRGGGETCVCPKQGGSDVDDTIEWFFTYFCDAINLAPS